MPRGLVAMVRFAFTLCVLLPFCLPQRVFAQRVEDSCHAFFDNPHQALDCVEALFTQTDIPYYLPHLTVSSVPPDNGFPIGIAYDKRNYFVSSPFYNPNQPNKPSEGRKSLVDATAAAVISTNGSWYATGAVTWLPPIYGYDHKPNGDTCHRLWVFCTKQVFGIQFFVTHRTVQSIYFYGLGPSSPNTQLSYKQSETYGGALARMPLLDWLAIEGQIENRKPTIGFSSASLGMTPINESTAPGVTTQPDFMHYSVNIRTHAQAISEPVTNDPTVLQPGASPPPLMKHKFVWVFDNSVLQHWFLDQDNDHYSFRQTVIDGQETLKLHSVIRKFVRPEDMTSKLKIIKHFCNDREAGLKQQDECDFGEFLVRPFLVVSNSASGVVPFYFQPTLGGSDIESRLTLRGFDDYRFRALDAAMVSVDYRIPVFDPIGAMIFYDAGNVGNSVSALSFAHARQDGGTGVTLRIQKNVIAQVYFGWGAGHGSHFGYNFTKFF
jgi:hypothetical protein